MCKSRIRTVICILTKIEIKESIQSKRHPSKFRKKNQTLLYGYDQDFRKPVDENKKTVNESDRKTSPLKHI